MVRSVSAAQELQVPMATANLGDLRAFGGFSGFWGLGV